LTLVRTASQASSAATVPSRSDGAGTATSSVVRAKQRVAVGDGVERLDRPVHGAVHLGGELGEFGVGHPDVVTTTYLDIAHQYEVLDLLAGGRTVVAVLHDLNQAARYATDLVVLRDGRVATTGHPSTVLTPDLVADVFGLRRRSCPTR
jgi:hypothetical protein